MDWDKREQIMWTAFAYDALQELRHQPLHAGEHFPKTMGMRYGEFRYWADRVVDPEALDFLAQVVRTTGEELREKLATPASQP